MDLDPASWGGLELGLKIGPVKTSYKKPVRPSQTLGQSLDNTISVPSLYSNTRSRVTLFLHDSSVGSGFETDDGDGDGPRSGGRRDEAVCSPRSSR